MYSGEICHFIDPYLQKDAKAERSDFTLKKNDHIHTSVS